jgi:hypothetical protein
MTFASVQAKVGRLTRDPYGYGAYLATTLEEIWHYRREASRVWLRERSALRSVAFFPQRPHYRYAIWKFIRLLPVALSDDPVSADLVVWWCDETQHAAASQSTRARRTLNGRCTDISKVRVEAAFREAFGYAMEVDPRTHRGSCVKKSDANCAHDGQVVECPLDAIEDGFVYQSVIDNRVPGTDLVVDFRLVIVGRSVPVAFREYRPLESRFSPDDSSAELARVEDLVSAGELEAIFRFAETIGLDYGELDVLRDCGTNLLYVIDANKTPTGPPPMLTRADKQLATRKMADAFWSEFLAAES